MKTVYKYEVPEGGGNVMLPSKGLILTAGFQSQTLCLWVEQDDTDHRENRLIEVFGTGSNHPEGMGISRSFINTVFIKGLVFHVYERM